MPCYMTAMDKCHELLSCVWREVSRHVEIEEAMAQIGTRLKRVLPPHTMAVFRFHAGHGALESVVPLSDDPQQQATPAKLSLTSTEQDDLVLWARASCVTHHPIDADATPACLAPILSRTGMPQGAAWLAGPLVDEHGFAGILVFRTLQPNHFSPGHEAIAERLLDPFSVALKNDRRLHELELLRNAAEADKIAALRRLGRDRATDDIIGFHGGLKSVIARVEMVARTDMPVLILGETGTGKEVIARVIHERSARAGGPFLRVNSGAIPPELLDAELFGHEKGAFTGATATRRGWFERADGGTLLLDEIGELAKPAQVRLLRVLQEGSFERVGGEKTVHVDVRVVASTHRDLPAMVQQGAFREDLWYRISGFPVVLPPLRERRQDIPDLARHFAQRAARIFGLMPQFPTEEDLVVLEAYSWPGNIRELASVIDRAAILGDGKRLEIRRSLGAAPNEERPRVASQVGGEPRLRDDGRASGVDTLADAMRKHIQSALAAAQGRIEGHGGAAALLDINPHTLRARMRKLGIDWPRFRDGKRSAPVMLSRHKPE